MATTLKAPFPYFGGKSKVADLVWDRFGDVPNYVEPFAGSLAVLLNRPTSPRIETVNDLDCYLANFWRSLQRDPDAVADAADWPVNEADLHARHRWLVDLGGFRGKVRADPFFCCPKVAGWWVWGISQWIGSGWCSKPEWAGRGNGSLKSRGVHGKRPQLGRGFKGDVGGIALSLSQQLPDLAGDGGAAGRGVHASARTRRGDLAAWFGALRDRLRHVRVCCGEWDRILGPSPTWKIGTTGVFLDPPYASDRDDVYNHDSFEVAHAVRQWALENGDNPQLRIALCGYDGEHAMPESWECVAWKAAGGYGSQGQGRGRENAGRERIWFSPHCLKRPTLFDVAEHCEALEK